MNSIEKIEEEVRVIEAQENEIPYENQILYHYTDCKGLLSILKNKELWLSQREFMNDVYEQTYADKILKEAFNNVPNSENKFSTLKNKIVTDSQKTYLFSLSTEKDLTSQWVYYGKNDGYCLSFNVSKMLGSFSNFEKNLYKLVPR